MARVITVECAWCGKSVEKTPGAVAAAKKHGRIMFCDKTCFGLHRRKNIPDEAKRAKKAEYDRRRRKRYGKWLRAEKKRVYEEKKRTDLENLRAKQAANRQSKAWKESHAHCISTPEYKEYKSAYDLARRASQFGQYGECYLLMLELFREIRNRVPSYYERHREFVLERNKRYREAKAHT